MEKVFLDTNVALDVIEMREPHWKDAASLLDLSARGKIKAYVSAITLSTVSFLLEEKYSPRAIRNKLLHFSQSAESLPTSKNAIAQALLSDFNDIEDCIQYFTALEHGCIIVTRDAAFANFFEEHVMTPKEFLQSLV